MEKCWNRSVINTQDLHKSAIIFSKLLVFPRSASFGLVVTAALDGDALHRTGIVGVLAGGCCSVRNAELLCRAEGMLLVSLQELTFLFGVFLIRAK